LAYFPDLSPYKYIISPQTVQPDALNVGWLDAWHGFPTGVVDSEKIARLKALCEHPVNLCRGFHTCHVCQKAKGNGEIRVSGGGVTYAAPARIAHYVEAHRYLPPQSCLDALE